MMQLFVALPFFLALEIGYAWPLWDSQTVLRAASAGREAVPFKKPPSKLHGRFLHITGTPYPTLLISTDLQVHRFAP
jgi:hypothetical protein